MNGGTMTWRYIEYITLFWLIPLTLYSLREHLGYILIPLLIAIAIGCLVVLMQKGVLQAQWQKAKNINYSHLYSIATVFVILAALFLVVIAVALPDKLLDLPQSDTNTWLLILLLYPFISVFPQEVIFRSYFFHRYRKVFTGNNSRCFFSSLSFSLAHLLYANWIAVILSFCGSLLFSYRYVKTDNIALVIVEHSLWGMFIFTSGLGSFFIVSTWL